MPLISLADICSVYTSVKENIYDIRLPRCAHDTVCDRCVRFHNALQTLSHYSESDQLFMLEKHIHMYEEAICQALKNNDANPTRRSMNGGS